MRQQQLQQLWQATLGELQLQMTKATFDTWVKQTQLISCEDGTAIVGVQSGYAKDWLENRLNETITRTLSGILNRETEVRFAVWSPSRERQAQQAQKEALLLEAPDSPATGNSAARNSGSYSNGYASLNMSSKYTFDQFIVGSANRLAHAASLAVAENPAEAYNPLFLYGGVGLGKTHLLQAIAHFALRKGARVTYISSEKFTNDLINAIRTQSTDAFRECYRNTDYLLIDDIQFIAGKESTQEEFFHTFNSLHSSGSQIVLSSDRQPKAITTLEERLRSRFEWGLIADVQPPDLETRIAILRFKADQQSLHLPGDVTEFVARSVQSNIRELEGALNRVIAYSNLMQVPITMQLAKHILQDAVMRREHLTTEKIITAVARYYGVEEVDIKGRGRSKRIVRPRQVGMYLAREETDASLPQIGEAMGGRDHTTVLYACEKLKEEIETDEQLRRDMMAIREMLFQEAA